MKRMEPRCVVCSWPLRVVSHIVILNLRAPYLSIIFEVKSRFFGGQNWRLSPISIFLDFWYVFYTLYFSRFPQKTFLLQLVWGITIEWLDYKDMAVVPSDDQVQCTTSDMSGSCHLLRCAMVLQNSVKPTRIDVVLVIQWQWSVIPQEGEQDCQNNMTTPKETQSFGMPVDDKPSIVLHCCLMN